MLRLKDIKLIESVKQLAVIPEGKTLITTINANSYNIAQRDDAFAEALKNSDYIVPDGVSIVKACKIIHAVSQPTERVAGWDLFTFEMQRLNGKAKESNTMFKVMFLGSSEHVLALIVEKAKTVYPYLRIITYSPPYKPEFSDGDDSSIINAINTADPDLLWIGMTAPKQEKWIYQHWHELNIHCHVGTIGAVFDFFSGVIQRAPLSWQRNGFEWLYRLIKEPRRVWRRYVIGNPEFMIRIFMERFTA